LGADAPFDSRSFSEGWCPGATAITNLSWVQEQKLRSLATKPRFGGRKNHDNLSRFFNKKAGNNLPLAPMIKA